MLESIYHNPVSDYTCPRQAELEREVFFRRGPINIQRGFYSRAQDDIRFGRNESALQHFHEALKSALAPAVGAERGRKQLKPSPPRSDIAQKHPASRFIFTTDDRGEWNRMMTERPRWLTLLLPAPVKFVSGMLRRRKRGRTASGALHAYPGCGGAPAWSSQNGIRVRSSASGWLASTTTCLPMSGSRGRRK